MALSSMKKIQIIVSILILVGIPVAIYFFFLSPRMECGNSYDPDSCYFAEATQRKNLTLCDKIMDSSMRGSCYGGVVTEKNNYQKCTTLADQGAQDACYMDVAVATKDRSWCDKISIEDDNEVPITPYTKSNCYRATVSKNTPPAECENLTNVTYKDNCYKTIGYATNDASLCGKISDPYQKGNCYNGVARLSNDYMLCQFASPGDVNQCYLVIAENTKNAAVCELIKGDTRLWNNCFISLSWGTKDITLCDKLLNEEYRQNCRVELK